MSLLIVGAGLAGLVCARRLQEQSVPVTLLESSDDVGGRVRSDRLDGFVLDRGFQVLFDAYPAVRRNLDLDALDLQPFEPGAIICHDGRRSVLTDPLRDRRLADIVAAGLTSAIPLADKLRTMRLALWLSLTGGGSDQNVEPDTQTTLQFLRAEGFGGEIIDRFFRPFFGGIFLERELATTAAAFRFYFRMLATGRTTVPAAGMGAISAQLAAPLKAAGQVRCNAPVVELLRDGARIVGVRLADGSDLRAGAVVLAVDAPAAARLAGVPVPLGARQEIAIYFAGSAPLYDSRKILLNAAPDAFVNNAQLISNAAPAYAPAGRHLLGAVVLGMPEMDDRAVIVAAMRDLRRMLAGDQAALDALATYYPLRVYRIRYAQFPQLPGVYGRLPSSRATETGLYAAAEWTESSSINGALAAGERCAAAILEDLRAAKIDLA